MNPRRTGDGSISSSRLAAGTRQGIHAARHSQQNAGGDLVALGEVHLKVVRHLDLAPGESEVDVAVDLPVSTAVRQPRPDKPLFLTIREDHSLALGDSTVAEDDIGPALDAASGDDKEQRIFLRADKQVDYGALMEVMNKLRGAGYLKIAPVGLDAGESR